MNSPPILRVPLPSKPMTSSVPIWIAGFRRELPTRRRHSSGKFSPLQKAPRIRKAAR